MHTTANPPRFASPRTAIVRLLFFLYGALLLCVSGAAQTAVPYAGAPSFEIKKLVRAGNSFFAIGGDATLYHARVGEDWQPVLFSAKTRVIDIATDGKKLLLASVEEERGASEGKSSCVASVRTFALNDGQKPYYGDLGVTHSPRPRKLSLHYGGGRFVAWEGNEIMTTIDGKGWESFRLPEKAFRAKAVHFAGGSYLVLIDGDRGLLRTRDFKTWEPRIPVLSHGYMENVSSMTDDGRAVFQYSPRIVSEKTGEVYLQDKLMASADAGATWTAVSGVSTSPGTRLLGAFDEAGERHWLVFNDALFASVGNSLKEWQRLNAFDDRKLAAIGPGGGLFAEVVPSRGLMPFAPGRDLLASKRKSFVTRQVPATPKERLLARFIEWDNAASGAKTIAELRVATNTFASHTRSLEALTPEAKPMRLLALQRLALFASLEDIVAVAGRLAFDAIADRLGSVDAQTLARIKQVLAAKVDISADAAIERDYRRMCEAWEKDRVAFEPSKPADSAHIGYCDRETFQKRVFAGEGGAMIDLFDGYSTGRVGIVSGHAAIWWSSRAPAPKQALSGSAYEHFAVEQGSAWARFLALYNKYKAASVQTRPPMSDADVAELEKLFNLGINDAASMLVEEYSIRNDNESPAAIAWEMNAQYMRMWARRGAERGYGASMMQLAQTNEKGIGGTGKKDIAAALEWARRAVATGHPDALAVYTREKLAAMEQAEAADSPRPASP